MAACRKDKDEPLPAVTSSGQNTFGCKIDGQVFVPKKRSGFQAPNPISCGRIDKNRTYNNLYIAITNADLKTDLDLLILNCTRKGRYELGSTPGTYFEVRDVRSYGGVVRNEGPNSDWYLTRDSLKGYVDITRLDTISNIVAGTFAFRAFHRASGKQINVIDGRFDLKLGQ